MVAVNSSSGNTLFNPNTGGSNALSYNKPDVPAVATFKDNSTNITYNFPFNINTLNWNYNVNTQSFSTIGGRVTQLLSVSITTLQIQGEAGSRGKLINLFEDFKTMQNNQNQNKKSIVFSVPSQNLQFNVWLESFLIGWDPTVVTYPYSISAEVDEVITPFATNATMLKALQYVVNNNEGNIGFNNVYDGLSTTDSNIQYTDLISAIKTGTVTVNKNTQN